MNWSTSTGGGSARRTLASTDTLGSSDIVEDTRQFFTVDIVRRIALHRRLSCDSVERGIGPALSFLLAALAKLAARPLGAGILSCAVARQYPATLETIRNGIGSESQDVAAAYGSGYMAHLVGANVFATACTDIARSSGLGDQEAKLLVGLVGWVLMSQLRLQQRRQELSPSGLAYLLGCNSTKNSEDRRGRKEWRPTAITPARASFSRRITAPRPCWPES
jgi:hypothetical protein